jgi:hypothetical protein
MYFLNGTLFPDLGTKNQLVESVFGAAALGVASTLGAADVVLAGGVTDSAGEPLAGGAVTPPLKSVAYQPEPFN